MKYLTIIRHAKSSWDDPDLDDADRPLNARGKRAIGTVGAFLRQKGLEPDLILTSPALRARKTADGIAKELGWPKKRIRTEPDIYFGGMAELLRLISGLENTYSDVFLFGHEPLLSSLIGKLGGTLPEKFPTCAVYRFAFDTDAWEQVPAKKGVCEFFVYPKLLGGE